MIEEAEEAGAVEVVVEVVRGTASVEDAVESFLRSLSIWYRYDPDGAGDCPRKRPGNFHHPGSNYRFPMRMT